MCGNVMLVIAFSGLFSVDHVCTLENLALNKPTWQEHPWSEPNSRDFGSENAVDGMYTDRGIKGQCTINADGYYTAEWRVDLGSVARISYINIFYRTENQNPGPFVNRMAGFSLYISNTTSKDQGHLCYKDQSLGHPSVDQEIYCLIYGRYVIYYNERVDYGNPSYLSQYAYNELCEVEVYGCRGSFSDGCSYACPKNCLNRNCDAYTGYCLKCPQGYHGLYCQNECSPGYYGYNCVNQCSEHCSIPTNCDRVTGKCNGGCMSRWAGDTCDECQLGYYGTNCNRCSANCIVSGSCDRSSGWCYRGCQRGWSGSFCNQECSQGYYGYNCAYQCSKHCSVPSNCDRVTGICYGGCVSGWAGDTCNECSLGYYGYNCVYQCSEHCLMSFNCDRATGRCNGGCMSGWAGDTCKECQLGYYGTHCNRCSANCFVSGSCDPSSGHCHGGCQRGWRGYFCNQQCPPGHYGYNCVNQCSEHCSVPSNCDRVTGKCNGGCMSGWTGYTCNECQLGYYGINCNQCSANCNVSGSCDRLSGQCHGGCQRGWRGYLCNQECFPGYYGYNCSSKCSERCSVRSNCDRVTGKCNGGCMSGWAGDTCNECQLGYYGINCNQCSTNCNVSGSCDRLSGQCQGGCQRGWRGYFCNQECVNGSYGKDCSKQCSIYCNETGSCDRFTGRCDDGCKPGWKGVTCNEICDQTFYGINCSENCGSNCVNSSCHHVTGKCNVKIQSLKNTDSSNIPTLPVIGGTSAAIIILIFIIGVIIAYKRIRRSSKFKQNQSCSNAATTNTMAFSNIYQNVGFEVQNESNDISLEIQSRPVENSEPTEVHKTTEQKDDEIDIDEKIHEENPYGDFYVNEEPLLGVEISNLESVIKEKSKNENDGFKKEYAMLLYGERYPCDVGKRTENVSKNRFKKTFPYDHSRVVLANKRSDYINANYIDGIERERCFIAAQGPKQNTVDDFWWMIWQENVEQVVMLTNIMEGDKWKCIQYWPNLQTSMECGSFTVHSFEEKQYAFYVIRKLKVTNKKRKSASRTITQYHYTAWPDHGIPEPLCLLLFHDQVTRSKVDSHNGPVLVHCSAGIGRTGTYIAIDVLFEAGKTHSKINIAEYIKKMRRNRMNMVQTYEQYKTIFLTLHEMFKAPPTVLSTTKFLQKLQNEFCNKPANVSAFKKEFQKLLAVRPQYTAKDYKVTSQFHDFSSSIHPLDKYILFLTSNVPKRGRYINAIAVPSFTNQNAFIITNYPTRGDAVDFLRLITDYYSEVVVCMEPLCNKASTWLPTTTRSKQVTPFTTKLRHEQTKDIKSSIIELTKEGKSDETWSVEIAEPLNDIKGTNSKTVTHLLSLVSFARNIETGAPIIVLSRDGAALCGVFCAVYNLIQQLTMDEEIDVFSVVRLLQTRRPELCSSLEEYQLIQEALQSFIKSHTSESIYYNQ